MRIHTGNEAQGEGSHRKWNEGQRGKWESENKGKGGELGSRNEVRV